MTKYKATPENRGGLACAGDMRQGDLEAVACPDADGL